MAAAWAAKSTSTTSCTRASAIRLLNGAPPWLTCRRLITANPPLSQTTTIELVARQHRAVQVAVHHQVGAVADEDDDLAVGHGHLGPPRARDLVAHAGVAVLHVDAAHALGAPAAVELAGEAAGGRQRVVGGPGQAVDGPHDLGVGRPLLAGRSTGAGDLVDVGVVLRRLDRGPLAPGVRPPPTAHALGQLGQPLAGVGHQRQGQVLDGVEGGRVEPDEAHRLVAEHRPGAGREVLQAGPDGEDDVGLGGQTRWPRCTRSSRSARR